MAGRYASCQVPRVCPPNGVPFFFISAQSKFSTTSMPQTQTTTTTVGNTDLTITCCRYCKGLISITRRFKVWNEFFLMRRGQVVRRTRSQTGSPRDQQANHNQQQRPGRRRRASQSTVQLAESTEQAHPVEPPTIPLRRSARLNPGSTQSLANRAVEAEASRLQSRRRIRLRETRNTRNSTHTLDHIGPPAPTIINEEEMTRRFNNTHSVDGSGRSYSLQVAVQPPRIAQAGAPLYPPLAIRVHICDAETGEEVSGEDELNNLFAQATLYGENINSPPLAPPDMFLLSGRLSMSLDLLNDAPGESDEDAAPLSRQQGSYVIFPDLVINRTGHYRLGVSLFKVGGSRRGSSSEDPHGGGTSLEEAKSDVIIVQRDSAPIEIDSEEQQFLEHIRDRGTMVPSPPST